MNKSESWETASTNFHFGHGCIIARDDWAKSAPRKPDSGRTPGKCFVVTDANVGPHYAEPVCGQLEKSGYEVTTETLPPGEETKNPQTIIGLTENFAKAGLGRDDLVIGLGGGVVTDITGFAAAVYMRGVSWRAIPTSLLGQVDAAIGGKTGVDLRAGKNLFGTFHQPEKVIIDPSVLKTLPERHFCSGLVEVIKYGFIHDPGILDLLRSAGTKMAEDPGLLPKSTIRDCALFKSRLVEKDERDTGAREILNYGHTIGHALEAAAGYRDLLHGEALVFGMAGAAMIGARMGTCGEEILDFTKKLFSELPVRRELPSLSQERIMEYIYSDKKKRGGELRFVLPIELGKVTVKTVDRKTVEEVVERILAEY
jgi:3-dehydroquinate synthase